jgi:hypothetical protein
MPWIFPKQLLIGRDLAPRLLKVLYQLTTITDARYVAHALLVTHDDFRENARLFARHGGDDESARVSG